MIFHHVDVTVESLTKTLMTVFMRLKNNIVDRSVEHVSLESYLSTGYHHWFI